MSPALLARSGDLRRLRDEGYEISIIEGHLVMTHVPYLNANREVKLGALVSELTLAGEVTVRPQTHVIRFAGEQPCDAAGQPLIKVINSAINEQISPGLVATFMFSSKPETGYDDYFHKMTTYAAMLATHVAAIDPSVSARTFRVIESDDPESIFFYLDTASSRAGIAAINAKLAVPRVAIIGLGGSGSYLLDMLSKAPIREIHLFDGDDFLQHNAFRAPSAVSIDQLRQRPKKVDYYSQIYSTMRHGIVPHPYFIGEDNVDELRSMSFAFICMDDSASKLQLIKALEVFGTSFIDVGLGLYEADGRIAGHVRTTTSTPSQRSHVWDERRIPLENDGEDDYSSNIQIAELNALNAAFAVIKWKKLLGFYADLDHEHHSLYTVTTNSLIGDDRT